MAKNYRELNDGEFASYIADLAIAYDSFDFANYEELLNDHTDSEKDRMYIEEMVMNHSYRMLLIDFL